MCAWCVSGCVIWFGDMDVVRNVRLSLFVCNYSRALWCFFILILLSYLLLILFSYIMYLITPREGHPSDMVLIISNLKDNTLRCKS